MNNTTEIMPNLLTEEEMEKIKKTLSPEMSSEKDTLSEKSLSRLLSPTEQQKVGLDEKTIGIGPKSASPRLITELRSEPLISQRDALNADRDKLAIEYEKAKSSGDVSKQAILSAQIREKSKQMGDIEKQLTEQRIQGKKAVAGDLSKWQELRSRLSKTGETIADVAEEAKPLAKTIGKKMLGVLPFATIPFDYAEATEKGMSKPAAAAYTAFEQVNPFPVSGMDASRLGELLSEKLLGSEKEMQLDEQGMEKGREAYQNSPAWRAKRNDLNFKEFLEQPEEDQPDSRFARIKNKLY
jgi:hypothetical protein